MSENTIALSQPESLHFINEDGSVDFGCDQEWYGSSWQRMAGCGPTVAATMLLYMHKVQGLPLALSVNNKTDCIKLMESVWHHVTPTSKGVYLLEQLSDGVLDFANKNGIALKSFSLNVPKNVRERPSISSITGFISAGLRHDCPVAFLNLSNGKVLNLDEWHWVTIVSLEVEDHSQEIKALMYDGAKQTEIDLKLWSETTLLGGGFVYFTKQGHLMEHAAV